MLRLRGVGCGLWPGRAVQRADPWPCGVPHRVALWAFIAFGHNGYMTRYARAISLWSLVEIADAEVSRPLTRHPTARAAFRV